MDTSIFRRLPLLDGDGDPKETAGLQALGDEALAYLRRFPWCPAGVTLYLAYGVARVVGLFLAEFDTLVGGSDHYLWVVTGDLPSAYFVTDEAPDAKSALTVYCELMQDWVDAVHRGGPMDSVFPVAAESSEKYADLLQSRVDFVTIRGITGF
jgi:hypothetical protein